MATAIVQQPNFVSIHAPVHTSAVAPAHTSVAHAPVQPTQAGSVLLPISQLRPAPAKPNQKPLDESQVANLKATLEAGLTLPAITVRLHDNNYYEIVSGLEIYSAHTQLGHNVVPCIIQSAPIQEAKAKPKPQGPKPDLTDKPITEKMQFCYDQYVNGLPAAEVIQHTGISNSNLYIRVWHHLHADLKKHLDTKVLPVGAADELIQVDPSMQTIVFNAVTAASNTNTVKLEQLKAFIANNPTLLMQSTSIKNIPRKAGKNSTQVTKIQPVTAANSHERYLQAKHIVLDWLTYNALNWSELSALINSSAEEAK